MSRRSPFRRRRARPQFSVPQILAWADAFHARTGQWPKYNLGPIPESAGESWTTVDEALRHGKRGLAGGGSLARLLDQERRRKTPA